MSSIEGETVISGIEWRVIPAMSEVIRSPGAECRSIRTLLVRGHEKLRKAHYVENLQ